MNATVRGLAHAKINLHLAVLGRREDGYHELDTVMAGLALADELELTSLGEARAELVVEGPMASPDIPRDQRNLVHAAITAGMLRARSLGADVPAGWRLRLTKHIPSQAGLGGGSSDGAAALRLVEDLCAQDLGAGWRCDWLAQAGSDTVFFDAAARTLHGRCRGRGERVEELKALPGDWRLVLVTPDVVASTGRVFSALDLAAAPGGVRDPAAFAEVALDVARASLRNDLQAAALAAVPGLSDWARRLDRIAPGRFAMSGSGSSFFALCAGQAEASELHFQVGQAPLAKRLLWMGSFAKALE